MASTVERRYGAIAWDASAEMDEAIRFVQACDDKEQAVRLVESFGGPSERWAVVDLVTLNPIATGPITAATERPPA